MDNSAIARSARRLRSAVFAVIGFIVLAFLVGQLGLPLGHVRVEAHAAAKGWAGTAVTSFALALFVVALFRLTQMLAAIADGPLFGPRVTRAFRGFALWLFVATLVDVVADPLVAIAQTIQAGGDRTAVVLSLRDLLMLAGAMFLFLLARMMEQARAIEAELEEIV